MDWDQTGFIDRAGRRPSVGGLLALTGVLAPNNCGGKT